MKKEKQKEKQKEEQKEEAIIKNMIREKTDEEYICNITGCSDKELSLAEES